MKRSVWFFVLITLALSSGCFSGCGFVPAKNASSLKPIMSLSGDIRRPAFETRTMGHTDFLVARGAIGKYGGTFYTASIGDGPKTFNPWAASDGTSSMLGSRLISGLVESDAYTGEVYPLLAKNITVSPNHCVYTVKLRKGLLWSDGKPLTADDVVFTWNEIIAKGLGNPSSRDNTLVDGKFPEVKKIDSLTIQFTTEKPFAPFVRRLGAGIAPKHVFKPIVDAGGDAAFSAAWGNIDAVEHPETFISSGMWLLDKYDLNEQRVIFKRNPRFFMVDKKGRRLPYLDRFIVSFVKDQNNLQLQFEQGNLDTYAVSGQYVSLVRKLKKPAFKLYNLGPAQSTLFLTFNLNTRNNPDTHKPVVDPIQSAWFTDKNFRLAIDYALNREDMVTNILRGVGAPLFTAETPASPFLNRVLAKGHPRDLEKSRKLLKASGFWWRPDGQLMDKKGHPVVFTLLTNTGNDQREATGVSIKQDLSDLGMTVYFKPIDFNVLVGKMDTGDWQAIIMGLGGGSPLEPHDAANVWKSDAALHLFNQRDIKKTPVDLSDRFDWEIALDHLFETGAQTFDLEKRKEIYRSYQQVVSDNQPFIYLYSPLVLLAVKDRIQNFDPTLLEPWHNMEEIWVRDSF